MNWNDVKADVWTAIFVFLITLGFVLGIGLAGLGITMLTRLLD